MAMLVRRQQRRVFLQTPIVLKVWLYSALLAPCLAPATIASREGGSETAAIAQDLLRTKLALTIPRASSTTADEIMDRGVKGQCQGQGLSEAVSAASTATEAAILSGDVSDDEDLTQSGSGVYLQEVKTEIPRHTQLLHTLKENKRGTWHFSCCAAGRLAASRHLHCHAQFHVHILRMRESADVTHTTQGTRLRQNGRLPHPWPRDMARCVLERPLLFQKCCYGYASARSDRHHRFHHRKVSTGSFMDMYLSWRYINS